MLTKRTCLELQKGIVPIWLTCVLKYSTLVAKKRVNKWRSALLVNANEKGAYIQKSQFQHKLIPSVWVNCLGMLL